MTDHIVNPVVRATPARATRSLAAIATALWLIAALYGAELAARYSGDIVAMGAAPAHAMPTVTAPREPRPYMPAEANPASVVNLDPVPWAAPDPCTDGALVILYSDVTTFCGDNMAASMVARAMLQ